MQRFFMMTVFGLSLAPVAMAQGTDAAVAKLAEIERRAPGSIETLEGLNEPWNFPMHWNGKKTDNWATVEEAQRGIHAAVKAVPSLAHIPMLAPSIEPDKLPGKAANFAPVSDGGNTHAYPYNGRAPGEIMSVYLGGQKELVGTKPARVTELGAGVGSGEYGFTPRNQAAVLTTSAAAAYQKGAAGVDFYHLFNYAGSNNSDPWSNNGLFQADGTPTQAATAIHNMTSAIRPQQAISAVTPLPYRLEGAPSTAGAMALQRGRNDYAVMVWNDVPPGQAGETKTTVRLGATYGKAVVIDPLTGKATSYANVSSVPVALSDHPMIVQLSNPTTRSAGVAAGETRSASDFIRRLGVNTHLNDRGENSAYGDVNAVWKAMQFLGITRARDETPRDGNIDQYVALARKGARLGLIVGNNSGQLGVVGEDMGTGRTSQTREYQPTDASPLAASYPIVMPEPATAAPTTADTSFATPEVAPADLDKTIEDSRMTESAINALPRASTNTPIPEAAAAAGYTLQTLGGGLWPSLPWRAFDWMGTDPTALRMEDHGNGSVTLSGGGNGFNAHLSTASSDGNGGCKGIAFGGGAYFEATLSWTGGYQGWGVPGSNGWPSFWMNDVELTTGRRGHGYEPDVMEAWEREKFGSAVHYWIAGQKDQGNTTMFPEHVVSNMDPSQPHKYGMLWIPARIRTNGKWVETGTQGSVEFFFNGKPIPGRKMTWGPSGSDWSDMDDSHFYLLLGTGSGNPTTVYDVQAWQRDTTHNTCSDGQIPMASGAPTSGAGAQMSGLSGAVPFAVPSADADSIPQEAQSLLRAVGVPSAASLDATGAEALLARARAFQAGVDATVSYIEDQTGK